MTHPDDKPSASADPTARVAMRPAPWAVFLFVVALVLAGDLGLKYWAFNHVADFPVRVVPIEGKPHVQVQSKTTGQWRSAQELGLTGDQTSVVPRHQPIVVIPGALNLQLTLNQGAVFGSAQGMRPVFISVSILATAVILVLLYRSPRGAWFYQAGLALILGGALGNLYDRVEYAAVRDMLHMLPGTGLWPWIFNVADVALVCGVGLVLVVSWWSEHQRAKQAKANS